MGEQTDRSLRDVAFTRRWYRNFLERLQADGHAFRGFGERLRDSDVLVRHDVDLSLSAALAMAELEAEMGVRSTYCIQLSGALYNPLVGENRRSIRRLAALGHDVALHFSTHEYWEGRPKSSEVTPRVRDELSVLSTILDDSIETVSFHIPPEWVLGERFDGFVSTYEPRYFEDCEYVADSTQRWRSEPPAVDQADGPVQLLAHPGLWGDDDADFETCIRRAIVEACQNTQLAARREFLSEVAG